MTPQIMSSSNDPIVGKMYWIRRSHRDEHAELWKCDDTYVSESRQRQYLFVKVEERAAPWVMDLLFWDILHIRGRCWPYHISNVAGMTQANPFMITTEAESLTASESHNQYRSTDITDITDIGHIGTSQKNRH
jgi:hypothetical protein